MKSKKPGQFQADHKKLICPHCGGDEFVKGEAQLNTSVLTFLDLDWANRSATTLACTRCGRIEWFCRKPERIS